MDLPTRWRYRTLKRNYHLHLSNLGKLKIGFYSVFASQRRVNNEKRMLRAKSGQLRDLDLTYFWDYEEIMEYIDAVALEYPDIVTVERLLDSYEGRRIVSITITAPGENEDRPIILIDSTIHAR